MEITKKLRSKSLLSHLDLFDFFKLDSSSIRYIGINEWGTTVIPNEHANLLLMTNRAISYLDNKIILLDGVAFVKDIDGENYHSTSPYLFD